ncbi:MAG: PKD domain-containing protein [Nanoarchaeota archaeon]|nr:PKD domain-containing protein [Nanoarchaeota archaeon]
MGLKKIISVLVLFSLLLVIPGAIGAAKTFQVQETDLVTISPEALDPDNDQVTYFYSLPLDEKGQWQTGYNDAGEYRLKIIASDGVHKTAKEVILIVENKNQAPYQKEKKVAVKELQTLELRQFAADPDEDPLEYVFTPPFDKNGRWTPDYDDQGTFVAKFIVKDGEFTIPLRVEVEVLDTNQPPAITASFSDARNKENTLFLHRNKTSCLIPCEEKISLKENEELPFYVEAEDGDDDPVSYFWTLNGQSLTKNSSGDYSFDFASSGEYELAVMVSDIIHQVEKKWQVNVENVNRKPEIGLSPITVQEGEIITLELPEKDVDGDTLTYTFDHTFDEKGNWQTTFEDAGKHNIKFYVSDGIDEVKEKVEVTILNVDRAPELHLPGKLEVKEGGELSFMVNVSDPDGEEVEVSFVNAPEGALYDQDTNTFTWSPGYDYIKRRGGLLSNILNALRLEQRLLREKLERLEVKVCSQELCSTGFVPVVVSNSNQPPVLEMPSALTMTEGEVLQLQPNSYDPDGDIVRYYFTEPAHKRKGHWETAYEDAGEYTIYVTATDGVHSQTMPLAVTVLQKNRQPTVVVPRDQYQLYEGEEFVLPFDAFDYDNDTLSLSVENLPKGASFKNNTLVWKPDHDFVSSSNASKGSVLSEVSFLGKGSDSSREHWISFVASDKEFDVNHPVKLVVKNVNQKPELISVAPIGPVTLRPGQPHNFSVNTVDADGSVLSYSWTFEPGGEKITGANMVERTFTIPGEKKVSVVVSDGEYEFSQEWDVTVPEEVVLEPLPKPGAIALEEPKFKVYVIEH